MTRFRPRIWSASVRLNDNVPDKRTSQVSLDGEVFETRQIGTVEQKSSFAFDWLSLLSLQAPALSETGSDMKILCLLLLGLPLFSLLRAENGILLISPDELSDAWKPFAEWKTSQGKPTRILKLSEIETSEAGRDVQEKIRAAVLASIDQDQVKWIILGADTVAGSSKGIPTRATAHPAMGRKYRAIPSDRYYLSTGNWDANGNGRYGEWPEDIDSIQYAHEHAVIGRIPVRSQEDVKAYTDKVIAYESRKEHAPSRMVVTCAVPSAEAKLHTSKKEIRKIWPEGEVELYFTGKTPWDEESDGDHDLSPANWRTLINGGEVEKMHIHGHGLIQNWILEHDRKVTLKDVEALENRGRPLFLTTVSCFTGQFDHATDPSIAEAMLRKENGGALVVLAPSREGIPIFMNPRIEMRQMVLEGKMDGTTETMTGFWQAALETPVSVGEAFARSQARFETNARNHPAFHFLLCELNLLGDPSLVLSR